MKTEDTSQQDGIGTDKSSAGGDAVGVPSGAWFGLFAAHAPEIPTWFKRKEWREKVVEPMPESPDGRTGWVHEVMKDRVEEPMDYLVRWRMAYAAAMVAALPNSVIHPYSVWGYGKCKKLSWVILAQRCIV